MKIALFVVPLAIALLFSVNMFHASNQSVNSVIGDRSFTKKYGHEPDQSTDNNLRVRTHLLYVEDLLRHKDVSHLSADMQAKRTHLLNLLHEYTNAGVFPQNYDYANERKPCFIDKHNNICAVGHLIEKTAGREVAEKINAKYKYEEIMSMHDPAVDNWVKSSGLTKVECAMIQPTYYYRRTYNYNYIPNGYGITSSIIGGVNLSLNTINGVQISKKTTSKAVALTGMLTGAGQVILGAANFPSEKPDFNGQNQTNESKKTLSMINIGLGSTTLILSTWNLITNKKNRDRRTSWNLQTFPDADNKKGMVVSMTRRF